VSASASNMDPVLNTFPVKTDSMLLVLGIHTLKRLII